MVASVGTPGVMKSICPDRIASIMAVAFESVVQDTFSFRPCFSACFSRSCWFSITMNGRYGRPYCLERRTSSTSARAPEAPHASAANTMSARSPLRIKTLPERRPVVPDRAPSILPPKMGNDKETPRMAAQSYNAAVDMVDRNVAQGRAGKTAFIDPARKLSYGELTERAARVGPMLARLGLKREDRVAMMMLDTVDFPVLFWGAIRAGIVPVPLNTLLTAEQYGYILEDSRAHVLFVSAPLLPIAQQAAAGLDLKMIVVGEAPGDLPRFDTLLAAETKGAAPALTHADEVAFWLYSSGSTGMPKGVRHVHSSAMETARLYAQGVMGINESDVVFSAAKLFFAYGLGNGMSFPMSVGATAVLLPDRPTPQAV